jgi:hypothetical protein
VTGAGGGSEVKTITMGPSVVEAAMLLEVLNANKDFRYLRKVLATSIGRE